MWGRGERESSASERAPQDPTTATTTVSTADSPRWKRRQMLCSTARLISFTFWLNRPDCVGDGDHVTEETPSEASQDCSCGSAPDPFSFPFISWPTSGSSLPSPFSLPFLHPPLSTPHPFLSPRPKSRLSGYPPLPFTNHDVEQGGPPNRRDGCC